MSEAQFFHVMRDKSSESERRRQRDQSERGDLTEFLKNDAEGEKNSTEKNTKQQKGAAKK